MKKFHYILALALGVSLFTACSDEEDLTPSGAKENYFYPDDDATDEESEIRREFYKQTGSYLLFNDTLRKEFVGLDSHGVEVWKIETIDFGYNMTGEGSENSFGYIEDMESKKALVDLYEKFIMPRVGTGQLAPYSVFFVDDLKQKKTRYPYNMVNVSSINCMRALAIDGRAWLDSEGEEQEYAQEILLNIIQSRFKYDSPVISDFYKYTEDYYWADLVDVYPDWDGSDKSLVYSLGFVAYGEDYWGEHEYDYFYGQEQDFNAYLDWVLHYSEEEFMEEFGVYPVVVEKYNMMKQVIMSLGYNF